MRNYRETVDQSTAVTEENTDVMEGHGLAAWVFCWLAVLGVVIYVFADLFAEFLGSSWYRYQGNYSDEEVLRFTKWTGIVLSVGSTVGLNVLFWQWLGTLVA